LGHRDIDLASENCVSEVNVTKTFIFDDDFYCFSVFNVGEYRRDAVKVYAGKEFFDPDNTEAVAVRKCVLQSRFDK
jgi:hypothetical protein